jgi:predicted ATPase/DNA-binding SARP family transcriptional activator
MSRFELALFGPVEVTLNGKPCTDSLWAKTLALLVYLAVESDRPHRREVLAGLLWPEQPDKAARSNLRQALHQLRKALGQDNPSPLLITPQTVQFDMTCDVTLDVAEFNRLIESTQHHHHRRPETCSTCIKRLERAVALYRGDFLAGFFLRDSVAFEEWVMVRRERLRQSALFALNTLAAYSARREDYAGMEQAARRQVELDPFREEAHRQLMQALAWAGRPNAALVHYKALNEMLALEMDLSPESRTADLYEQIDAGSLASPSRARLCSWPAPLTPLLGRDAELEALAELLQTPAIRLVTVVGAGGIGKTRLALEVAEQQAFAYDDGACFVPLAAVTEPAYIVSAIAAALGYTFSGPDDPLEQLWTFLLDKDVLLVLDSFEHLLAGARIVTELLTLCPGVQILVTSRESLHLRGEQHFPLSPLALPDLARLPQGQAAVTELGDVPAIALFVHCARSVQPDFALSAENSPVVAEICVRLDGLPLAIELAAARVQLFTPVQMLPRLSNRLALLVDGARDLPPRQKTLRATLDWSYELLTPFERQLFAQLAVFAGGFTLEAAQVVCGGQGELEILDEVIEATGVGLHSLLDKGLLQRQGVVAEESRFSMLETIREYAKEWLVRRGEQFGQQARHAAYFLQLSERANSELKGAQQQLWLNRLMVEQNNLRLALRWGVEQGESETVLRLSSALWWSWYLFGHFNEGRSWLEAALDGASLSTRAKVDSGGPERATVLASVLNGAGVLAGMQGDYVQAVAWLEEALVHTRPVGDKARTASVLAWLGWAAYERGDDERSRASYEESLTLSRERGAAGQATEAFVLNGLGEVARHQKDYAAARTYYEESLALRQELGDQIGIVCTLHNLGRVLHEQGDSARAGQLLGECLSLAWELQDKVHIVASMAGLATVAQALGQIGRAAQLLAQAETLLHYIGATLYSADLDTYEHTIAAVREQLDEASFATAWEQGQKRPLEQAVAYALADEGSDYGC